MKNDRRIQVERLGQGPCPREVVAVWPESTALAALLSSGKSDGTARGDRWSVVASPALTVRFDLVGGVTRTRVVGWPQLVERSVGAPEVPLPAFTHDPITDFAALVAWSDRACAASAGDPAEPMFVPGWIGHWSYELGGVIEPSACERCPGWRGDGALGQWQWCPAAYVFDHRLGEWSRVGARWSAGGLPEWDELRAPASGHAMDGFTLEGVAPAVTPERYARAVERAVEYIREGDVFQVNLAHPLRGRWSGSARGLFASMHGEGQPPYGAYIEDGGGGTPAERTAIASISPELFLRLDRATGMVTTRPIKGTRRVGVGQERAVAEGLLASAKDAAELAMIVDLMRNDLGRVCAYGSIRVAEPRTLESHGGAGAAGRSGLLHTVAEVVGRLRPGVGVGGLLRATYPAGSITGAPKVRAMQVIEGLERGDDGLGLDPGFVRGVYTGAIGLVNARELVLNVAIRTAVLRGTGAFEYAVGAGIVAESDPGSEWRETLDKAEVVRRLGVDRRGAAGARSPRLMTRGAGR